MGTFFRFAGLVAPVALLAACGDSSPTGVSLNPPAASRFVIPRGASPVGAAIALGVTPMAIDEHGIPRLFHAAHAPLAPAATATETALIHVRRLAPAWGVRTVPGLEALGEVTVGGGTIVRLRQTIDGMPVDGGELRVYVTANGGLVAASGLMVGAETPRARPRFVDDDVAAVSRAMHHTYGSAFDGGKLVVKRRRDDGSRILTGRSGTIEVQLANARKIWHRTGDHLTAAWVTEAYASATTTTNGDAFQTITAADDGRVLEHHSLVADASFNYRVFAEDVGERHPFDGPIVDSTPHPTGVPTGLYPAYVTPNLVAVDGLNHPVGSATADSWLPAGATETVGNNVEAYTDLNAPTGLSFGDFRATVTAAGSFDRTFDTAQTPLASQAQQMAGITSLFYTMNWLHDFWYDHGFTETAGNGQDQNFGRGGQDRDALLAEAQDNALGGSRNNANMSTPSDGLPPRMQVFVWSGKQELKVTAQPADRGPTVGSAAFGPQSFDATGLLVLADDGTAPGSDACTPLTNNVTGKVVLVDRGACGFKSKVLRAQQAGAIGVVLANNQGTTPINMADDATITTPITIGTISVTLAEGTALKTDLGAGSVNVTLHRLSGVDLEGTLDASVVGHEFGHYLHHRLSLCDTTMCAAMSEGWADFSALLLQARDGDDLTGAYPVGIYSTQSFNGDPAYFGIRRAPYSVKQTINSLAFHHMSNDAVLPTTHPFLAFGNNAEVHNAGEVWAAMLWEGYVALQQATPGQFDAVRAKMAEYVVAGLLIAPPQATPTEMRDAILTAVHAASVTDHDVLAAAYARRGFGSCAVSADRDSTTFIGIVDSTELKGNTVTGAVSATPLTSCDTDGAVDGGETGRIVLPIANRGPVDLTNVTVTVTSTTPGVTIATAAQQIATLPAYGTADITVDFSLADTATTPLAGDFAIEIAAANACNATLTVPLALRLNVDDVASTSATDTFDTAVSVWTAATDSLPAWRQTRETALDGAWHADDNGSTSNTTLTSPMLTADATTPVTVTFQHSYQFEGDATTAFDGGVIEISTNGITFNDVTTFTGVDPGYNGTLTTGGSNNPLAGRLAYVVKNAANPAVDTVTLDFGTQLAGQTFQLRFRVGTDQGAGAPGWDIDDVVFTGIVGTPFPTQVADAGDCAQPMPDAGVPVGPDGSVPVGPDADEPDPMMPDGDGGCCDAGPLRAGNFGVALGVLALLLRRRRR